MKISQVIKKLEGFKRKHGDIKVSVLDPDQFQDGIMSDVKPCFVLNENERGVIDGLTVLDPETLEALK